MGALFTVPILLVAVAFVAGFAYLFGRLTGRARARAALQAVAFCVGSLTGAAIVVLVATVTTDRATLLSPIQGMLFLSSLLASALIGGVGCAYWMGRRSNNRWSGP
jgi:hypothetical protein